MNLTLADVDYLALADVWFRDLETGEEATATAPTPLGRGVDLAPRAGEGAVERSDEPACSLRFADDDRGTTLVARSRRSGAGSSRGARRPARRATSRSPS